MKIEKKLDCLFWFLITLLPLIGYFIAYFRTGTAVPIAEYVALFRFDFVADLMLQIFSFGGESINVILVDFASWLVLIELVHILVDAILFIFRVVRSWLEGGIYGKMY